MSVQMFPGPHSVHSLMHAKHALGSTVWCMVEPHHHAEGVLVLSPDIEVTSESVVYHHHYQWHLILAGGCLPQAVGQLKVHCLYTQYIAIATRVAPNYVITRPRPYLDET